MSELYFTNLCNLVNDAEKMAKRLEYMGYLRESNMWKIESSRLREKYETMNYRVGYDKPCLYDTNTKLWYEPQKTSDSS